MRKLSAEQFKNLIRQEIRDGLSFIDSDIAKRRERNAAYYNIDLSKDLPARNGQSSVTDGTVPAQIGMMMPQLMRIMTGGPKIWDYQPNGLEDEAACKEATQYVNDVVMRLDNQGEDIVYAWGWDGLVQIVGVTKAYWEEIVDTSEEQFEGMSDMDLALLFQKVQADPRLEITAAETDEKTRLHTVTLTKTVNRSKVCVETIPPEDFVISANARSLEDAVLKTHRREMTVGDLLDMGFSQADVAQIPTSEKYDQTAIRLQRNQLNGDPASDGEFDPMLREVIVHQGIVRCNYDGKGLKDWYFISAGDDNGMAVLEVDEYDYQVVFADFCSDPIPHTFFGRCTVDSLIEPTKAKSAVMRQTMQNLYLANTPITLLQSDTVMKGTLESLAQRVPGGMALVKGDPTATVREVATPFFAQHSLPMLEYFDQESEKRTGATRAAAGLDPDQLTNQTATGANIM